MKKFIVPATWLVAVDVIVTAKDADDAVEQASQCDPKHAENVSIIGYVEGSFDAVTAFVKPYKEPGERRRELSECERFHADTGFVSSGALPVDTPYECVVCSSDDLEMDMVLDGIAHPNAEMVGRCGAWHPQHEPDGGIDTTYCVPCETAQPVRVKHEYGTMTQYWWEMYKWEIDKLNHTGAWAILDEVAYATVPYPKWRAKEQAHE